MATWEDGPEYAPLQRPDAFSVPDAAPLTSPLAPPLASLPAGPVLAATGYSGRPQFADPQGFAVPLDTIEPPVVDVRDPAVPFAVVSSTVTSMDSAWGAAHWSTRSDPPIAGYPTPVPVNPWQPPTTAFVPASGPAATPGGYPSPGTPQWFGPGPYVEQRPAPPVADAKAILAALTPGLCIVLAIGGFFTVLAPVMLIVALALSSRVGVAQERIRGTLRIAMAVLLVVGVLGVLAGPSSFGDWWDLVGLSALVICWVVLVTAFLAVRQTLRTGLAQQRLGSTPTRFQGPGDTSYFR